MQFYDEDELMNGTGENTPRGVIYAGEQLPISQPAGEGGTVIGGAYVDSIVQKPGCPKHPRIIQGPNAPYQWWLSLVELEKLCKGIHIRKCTAKWEQYYWHYGTANRDWIYWTRPYVAGVGIMWLLLITLLELGFCWTRRTDHPP